MVIATPNAAIANAAFGGCRISQPHRVYFHSWFGSKFGEFIFKKFAGEALYSLPRSLVKPTLLPIAVKMLTGLPQSGRIRILPHRLGPFRRIAQLP